MRTLFNIVIMASAIVSLTGSYATYKANKKTAAIVECNGYMYGVFPCFADFDSSKCYCSGPAGDITLDLYTFKRIEFKERK